MSYRLDLREAIDSSMYYDGVFEPLETAIVKNVVKDGMTVIDIGANIGYYTLLFAKLVSNGEVIAFEPSAWAVDRLKHNIELNDVNNISVMKSGLSDECLITKTHFRTSWTIDGSEQNLNEQETIVLITLDDYIASHNIEKVDFIKIDVDGFEDKVIKGAINTLRRDMPMLLIEISRDTALSVLGALETIGYKFYSAELKKLNIKSIKLSGNNTINVLCTCEVLYADN